MERTDDAPIAKMRISAKIASFVLLFECLFASLIIIFKFNFHSRSLEEAAFAKYFHLFITLKAFAKQDVIWLFVQSSSFL